MLKLNDKLRLSMRFSRLLIFSILLSFSNGIFAARSIHEFWGDKLVVGCGHNWADYDEELGKISHQHIHPKWEYYAIDGGWQEGRRDVDICLIDEEEKTIGADLIADITKEEELISIPSHRFSLAFFEYLPFTIQYSLDTLENVTRLLIPDGQLVMQTFVRPDEIDSVKKILEESQFHEVSFEDPEFIDGEISGYQKIRAKSLKSPFF